jgi:GMP synthase (glutamine-hydrolysing)
VSEKRVIVLQHAASEDLGTIENALPREAIEFRYLRTFEGEPVPKDPDVFSTLIIMGGPMGVYETERYPFLASEMNLIEQFLKAQKPIFGVCLGSQLLAADLEHVAGNITGEFAQVQPAQSVRSFQ